MEVTLLYHLGIGGAFLTVESHPDSPRFLYPLGFGGMGLYICFCPVCSECNSPVAMCSWLPDFEDVLLLSVSELSVLACTVLRGVFGIDHCLLKSIGEEVRVRNSFKGVGVSGQSFRQRAGMLSADSDTSPKGGAESRARNSFEGVGGIGQALRQRAGMLSADSDISLKRGGL